MAAKKGTRSWWWIIVVVAILAGLGAYWYLKAGPEKEAVPAAQKISPDRRPSITEGGREGVTGSGKAAMPGAETPDDGAGPEGETPGGQTSPIEKGEGTRPAEVAAQGPIEELFVKADASPPAGEAPPKQAAYCTLIDRQISGFFESLDRRPYFRQFNLETDAYGFFARVVKRLSARPPQPAGEGIRPAMLIANVYFFSRALDLKDIRVIKAVIGNEGDALEYDLETFYRWLMLGKHCPDPADVRPPFDVTYRYAGFFLNTTGGRSYLFRRPLRSRILVSYYCLLIVYQADRLGMNSYGIDVVPYLKPLKEEIAHHPELEFQDQYLRTLNRIADYYRLKR